MDMARGTTKHRQAGGVLYSLLLTVTFVGIVSAGTVTFIKFTATNPMSPNFIEETPPELRWHEEPRGLGAEPVKLALTASDADSGLDEVVVRISQQNQSKELVRKKFNTAGISDETIEFTVSPKELKFREGNAELQVLAFDKSLWNNGTTISKILEINFMRPQIEVITPQQNGVLGGSELVFYRVKGKAPNSHGVLGQGTLYPGFSAAGWDNSFEERSRLFVAFYPIPESFNPDSDTMKVIARDNLGNSTFSPFYYRVRMRRWSSFRVNLSEERGTQLRESMTAYAQHEKINVKAHGTLANDLRSLIKALSVSDEGFISTALSEPTSTRLWQGAFIPPVSSAPNNSAGDVRSIQLADTDIARGPSSGVRFPVSRRTPVLSGNEGKVVFIGELGLLGNTIIIDHGMGLSTIYGHLSEVSVQRGARVQKQQAIGSTGTTGFSQGEEVYFEIRLHGVPVSPNEWWDETWVTDHIENKVNFVKQQGQ
jgi:murein DD-endopeptidase MepM/ murein hydrolase activator NlpD